MSPQAATAGVGLSREAPASAQSASCCATALRRGVGGRRIRVTIVRSIRTRRRRSIWESSPPPHAPAATATASARSVGVTAEIRRERARICFRIPRVKGRRCARLGSSSCGKSGDIGTTSGDRQGMIGGVQPPIERAPRGAPARGGPWAARCSVPAPWSGGWVGPEVTAARPSRAQDVRISTFLLVLEGARAAFNDAALGQGGCALSGRERPWRQRALGASGPRECVAGWRRSRTVGTSTARACAELSRVEHDDAVGATADWPKGSATRARALRLLDTRGNDAMSPRGAAASPLAASASMSSDPSRPRSRPGRAAAETALPRPG
jgi:hypothetical protein